ncbi:MAG: hypothetical protein ACI4TT_00025 [Christensenellales bacterium]
MDKLLSKAKNNISFKTSKVSKNTTARILLSLVVCVFIVFIAINPALCINSIYNGLSVWAKCVLPSLLPFMFFTKILTDLDFVSGITKKLSKLTKFLFNAPSVSAYIFFMSLISGYPVGAKLISEFYEAGVISTKQANKLTTFCSTSGPLFIIGSVGTAMFFNKQLGYILFASHILSSILNGILFRKCYRDDYEKPFKTNAKNLSEILPNSMSSSITSCLIVGGYIAIFFMIIDLANSLNLFMPLNSVLSFILSPFGVDLNTASALTNGIIEISKGCNSLAGLNLPTTLLGTLASFVISFGGFSVFFQSITFLSKCKVNMGFYLLQKFTHGILSAVITFIICLFVF